MKWLHSTTVVLCLILAACDGAAPGTGGGDDLGGEPGSGRCEGLVCNEPPARTCEDESTLRAWDAAGSCDEGICVYRTVLIPCAEGCDDRAGACRGEPCTGVSCAAPPAARCLDGTTLRTFSAPGTCSDGRCDYAAHDTTCANGCSGGACAGDACAGVSCTTPPAPSCLDATTRRAFQPTGSCAAGQCTYDAVSTTCQYGCAAGACKGDPCAGVACTTPPATYCKDASTLRSFAATGSCAGGGCVYAPSETPCAFGCARGACNPDPCIGVSCTTPPAKLCVNGTTLRSFAATGTCGGAGSCSYTSIDVVCPGGCANGACGAPTCGAQVCNTPPANTCLTTKRAKTYAPFGVCNAGSCGYQAIEMDCSTGCLNGSCLPGSYITEYQPQAIIGLATDNNVRIAIGADGQPRFAACDRNGLLFYREKTLIGWVNTDIQAGLSATGCDKSLAVGPNGEVWLAFYDDVNDDLRLAERLPGAATFTQSIVVSAGDVGRDPKVLVTPTGTLMIGYREGYGNYRLATRSAAGTWSTEPVATGLGPRSCAMLTKNGGTFAMFGDAYKNLAAYNQNPIVSGGKNPGGSWGFGSLQAHGFLGTGCYSRDALGTEWLMWAGNDYPSNAGVGIWIKSLGSGLPERVTQQLENNLAPVAVYDRVGPSLKVLTASTTFVKQNGIWMPLDVAPSMYPSDVATGPDGRLRAVSPGQWQITTIPICTPNCGGRICGDDGCGGSCGTCPNGLTCATGGHACY